VSTPRTPVADRFRHECDVPDPPPSPRGRQQYWDDAVFEAVAELRKRLRSQDAKTALEALEMIIDLEKTRIRHNKLVSGTHVPVLPPLDDEWGNVIPVVQPAERPATTPPTPEGQSASTSRPAERGRGRRDKVEPGEGAVLSSPVAPQPTSPRRGEVLDDVVFIPGSIAAFSDRDDDWTRDPGRNRLAEFDPRQVSDPPPGRYDAVPRTAPRQATPPNPKTCV
jgi:hypothetical protein